MWSHRDTLHSCRRLFDWGSAVETTHRVVSNLYNNLWKLGGDSCPPPPCFLRLCSQSRNDSLTNAFCALPQFVLHRTIDWEFFTLKIICTKNVRVDKFSWFYSILEIFLRKLCFIRVLNFRAWSQLRNYFNSKNIFSPKYIKKDLSNDMGFLVMPFLAMLHSECTWTMPDRSSKVT